MNISENVSLLKEGFEQWLNKRYKNKVSVVINYSDEQTLSIKAYHTVRAEVVLVGISNGFSYTNQLIKVSENYNHGVTSEEEAKHNLLTKLTARMFEYCTK
jgi:hypothetical protein